MNSVMQHFRRFAGALSVVGLALAATPAFAAGTAAGTNIDNIATVSFSVGGVSQTPIESSPTGNSTPGTGAGAATRFVVDRVVNFTLETVDTASQTTVPGRQDVVTTFRIVNTGNAAQSFRLAPDNLAVAVFTVADTFDMTGLAVFVGPDAPDGFATAALATTITALPADQSRRVFIVADTPLGLPNGAGATVQLAAVATQASGPNAGQDEVSTPGADNPLAIDVVVRTGTRSSNSGYVVEAPSLTVTQTSSVVSDPAGNTAPNAKAIPGAVVEYEVVVTNAGTVAADGVVFELPLPANTQLTADAYGASLNVQRVVGGATTQCLADSDPADGCTLSGTTLTIVGPGNSAIDLATAGSSATVRFRVTID